MVVGRWTRRRIRGGVDTGDAHNLASERQVQGLVAASHSRCIPPGALLSLQVGGQALDQRDCRQDARGREADRDTRLKFLLVLPEISYGVEVLWPRIVCVPVLAPVVGVVVSG